jgi:hypothetical protein
MVRSPWVNKLLPVFTGLCLVAVFPLHAKADWLTVVGLQDDADLDIVQVQLGPRLTKPALQAINLRVNRSASRTSTDGVVFRSFVATAVVDCAERKGRFTSSAFYALPLWQGQPHKTFAFSAAEVRPMLFRNIEPNPTERIIRAACPPASSGAVTPGAQK